MRRGEIWTVAGGKDYTGKPPPAVIVQDDRFDATDSITLCAFTTDPTEAPLFRLAIRPSERNGLLVQSRLTVDKIATVPKSKVGRKIGMLDYEDVIRLNRAIMVFLGLAVPPRGAGGPALRRYPTVFLRAIGQKQKPRQTPSSSK